MRPATFHLGILVLVLATVPVAVSQAQEISLQAEDALHCPDIQLEEEAKTKLNELITKRTEFLKTITAGDLTIGEPTLFGMRINEDPTITKQREEEHKAVLAILGTSKKKKTIAYATTIREQIETARHAFPFDGTAQLLFSQHIEQIKEENGQLKSLLTLQIQSPALSNKFKLQLDSSKRTPDGAEELHITLIHPGDRALIGEKPNPEMSLTLTQTYTEPLPTLFRIHARSIALDRPMKIDYAPMGEMPAATITP